MPHVDVLLFVNLQQATPYQEIEFLHEMEQRQWQRLEESPAFFAAFPRSIGDRDVIAQSERDLKDAAEYSGIDEWDAVCLLKDLPVSL